MFTKWINKPKAVIEENNHIIITAGEKTDFFIDPTSDFKIVNAPVYTTEVKNDFTLSCKVRPMFKNIYDAGAIMLYINNYNWVKFAFENTDLGYTSVVSVVTDNYSDDSNGEKIDSSTIWLKMTRKDKNVGLYYATNKKTWKMVRLFKHKIDDKDKVFIGLEAQSPLGKECTVTFDEIEIIKRCVQDLRKGV